VSMSRRTRSHPPVAGTRRGAPAGEDAVARRAGPGANLTGRAAVLALVVCLLAISLAYPLREYLAQRGQLTDYRSMVADQQKRVAELEKQRARWEDPAYVAAQARERLHYVMPGETSYVVLESPEDKAPDGVVAAEPSVVPKSPWFTDLWNSVEAAGRERAAGK
jgi:cell division protein FtsB